MPTPIETLPELFTPEELETRYQGRIAARRIKRLVAQGRVEYTRGSRRKVLFTEAQGLALLAAFAVPATTAPAPALAVDAA